MSTDFNSELQKPEIIEALKLEPITYTQQVRGVNLEIELGGIPNINLWPQFNLEKNERELALEIIKAIASNPNLFNLFPDFQTRIESTINNPDFFLHQLHFSGEDSSEIPIVLTDKDMVMILSVLIQIANQEVIEDELNSVISNIITLILRRKNYRLVKRIVCEGVDIPIDNFAVIAMSMPREDSKIITRNFGDGESVHILLIPYYIPFAADSIITLSGVFTGRNNEFEKEYPDISDLNLGAFIKDILEGNRNPEYIFQYCQDFIWYTCNRLQKLRNFYKWVNQNIPNTNSSRPIELIGAKMREEIFKAMMNLTSPLATTTFDLGIKLDFLRILEGHELPYFKERPDMDISSLGMSSRNYYALNAEIEKIFKYYLPEEFRDEDDL